MAIGGTLIHGEIMAFDRQYIFNKVMFILKQESQFFTSSEIHMMIGVDAWKRIAEDINYPKTNYSSYLTSGQYQVSAPSDFLKIDENSQVTYEDDSTIHELTPKKQTNIGRHIILNATPGTPSNYFMESETVIGVYPPSTSGCIVIPYVKEPTSMSADSDTNEISRQAYMANVYWVVQEAFNKDNDPRSAKYEKKYDMEIARLNKRFGERFEINYDLRPHEDYL